MKKKLQARLKAINEKCTAIVASADSDNKGVMTEEQQTNFDTLTAEYDQLSAQLSGIEKLEAQNTHLAGSAGRAASPAAPAASGVVVEENIDPRNGFHNIAEFASCVRSACRPGGEVDQRLQVLGAPANFHTESGSEGYEVPPMFREAVWELIFAEDDLLSMVDSEPTDSNSVEFLADETTPWGSAGIQAAWESEGAKLDPSKMASKSKQLKLHKLSAFVLATDELLGDAPRLANRLSSGAARAINWKANQAIVEGTGVGQPLGYNKSGSLVVVAKEAGQAAKSLVASNIAKMYSRVLGHADTVWRMNSDTLPELMTMTLGDKPIWTPPTDGFVSAPGGFLLGRPVQFSEHNETLGTAGDIELINPKGYYSPMKRNGIEFASSIHLYFDYSLQAFRWNFRMGGQPYLNAAVAPNKGTATKSHFVRLAARA